MITLKQEITLNEFDAWNGGADTLAVLSSGEITAIGYQIAEEYENGLTPTELNDILWFERDMIADWLGYEDFDELLEDKNA